MGPNHPNEPEPPEQAQQAGLTEYERFKAGLRQALSVPKEELDRREAEWQRQQEAKKNGKAKAAD